MVANIKFLTARIIQCSADPHGSQTLVWLLCVVSFLPHEWRKEPANTESRAEVASIIHVAAAAAVVVVVVALAVV